MGRTIQMIMTIHGYPLQEKLPSNFPGIFTNFQVLTSNVKHYYGLQSENRPSTASSRKLLLLRQGQWSKYSTKSKAVFTEDSYSLYSFTKHLSVNSYGDSMPAASMCDAMQIELTSLMKTLKRKCFVSNCTLMALGLE